MQDDINDLFPRETWKLVLSHVVPKSANIFGAQFVLAHKEREKNNPILKARVVLTGHSDQYNDFLVH